MTLRPMAKVLGRGRVLLNGVRAPAGPTALRHGDHLTVGRSTFRFMDTTTAASDAPPPVCGGEVPVDRWAGVPEGSGYNLRGNLL